MSDRSELVMRLPLDATEIAVGSWTTRNTYNWQSDDVHVYETVVGLLAESGSFVM